MAAKTQDYTITGNAAVDAVNKTRAENIASGNDVYAGGGSKNAASAASKTVTTPLDLSTTKTGNIPVSTPVVTSSRATNDLAIKQAAFNTAQTNNAIQAANLAQQKAQEAQMEAQKNVETQNQKNIQAGIDQKNQELAAKNAALGLAMPSKTSAGSPVSTQANQTVQSGSSQVPQTQNGQVSTQTPQVNSNPNTIGDALVGATNDFNQGLSQIDAAKDELTKKTFSQLNSVLKGTFPLSQPQQALVSSLQEQLTQNVASQKVANQSYTGAVTQAGFRSGGEYTPEQYAGQIANAISFGTAKIQELDNNAAETLAKLESDFQQENYGMITKNYDLLTKQLDDKASHIQALFTSVTSTLKDQRDSQIKAEQEVYNRSQDKIKIDMDSKRLASSLATDALQRQKLSADISAAKQAAEDAKNELPKAVAGRVAQIANGFDNESTVKEYNTIAGQVGYLKSLGDSSTDDQARIYAFAKIMDPNSAVKEGEYKTVQDYSQALLTRYGIGAKRIFENTGLLTEDARQKINDTISKKAAISEKQYDNVAKEYGRRIENVGAPVGTGSNYITNYKGAFDPSSQEFVDDYVTNNPDKADTIANLYDVEGATDNDVMEYINKFLNPAK